MNDLMLERRGAGVISLELQEWVTPRQHTYECRVWLYPETEGFSAHAIRLPGVVSEGETIDEALNNIRDAFQAVVRSYLDSNITIPWCDDHGGCPDGVLVRWILVDA